MMTHQDVTVSYSGGEWSGTLASEMVSIGGSPLVEAKFALIESASTFFIPGAEWVGILGLAYDSLAKVCHHAYVIFPLVAETHIQCFD